jgi:16S rRNA (uracil1498-N3)-methyltransferase
MQRKNLKNLVRLFVDADLNTGAEILTSADSQHYLLNVMRKTNGDSVLVFNGHNGEWRAEITCATRKQLTLICHEQTRQQTNTTNINLLFSPLKRDHLEYMVQKATELGVCSFIPTMTQHCVVKTLNQSRLSAIAREAAEQSERLSIPTFHPMQSLATAIFACLERSGARPIAPAMKHNITHQPATILVGPEGGFSNDEVELICSYTNVIPVSLGARILRADTAALAALSCWQALHDEFYAPT